MSIESTPEAPRPPQFGGLTGSASGLSVTIFEHPKGFLMRIEHDGGGMVLDRAEAFELYEAIGSKLCGMPVQIRTHQQGERK